MPFIDVPVAVVQQVAATHGFDPLLILAIIDVELRDGLLVSRPNKDGSRDYGLMQVNSGTLARMAGRWGQMKPEALLDPATGVNAGCWCLREYVKLALRDECSVATTTADAPALLRRLEGTAAHRQVVERAIAYYNGGPGVRLDAAGRWPNEGYVSEVLRVWDRLRAEDPGGEERGAGSE